MKPDFWAGNTSVLLTSFWDWLPHNWGTVSFTSEARRNNLVGELSDPFITVAYVTGNKSTIDPSLKSMVAGFYLVSHEMGHRDKFTHPIHHSLLPNKWCFGLRALRAFTFLPESRLSIDQLDPSIKLKKRYRAVASHGELIVDQQILDRLKQIPFEEVDVYRPVWSANSSVTSGVNASEPRKGFVRGGPERRFGYYVPDEENSLPRALYILRLDGDTDAFLGRPSNRHLIVKIGLSVSPELRRQSFQRTLPVGAFKWTLHRSTFLDLHKPYEVFEVAEYGELQMKIYLAKHGDWLGGEFYSASEDVVENAWQIGREAANSRMKSL